MRDKEPRRIKDNESISYLRFALLSLSINLIFLKLVEPWEREICKYGSNTTRFNTCTDIQAQSFSQPFFSVFSRGALRDISGNSCERDSHTPQRKVAVCIQDWLSWLPERIRFRLVMLDNQLLFRKLAHAHPADDFFLGSSIPRKAPIPCISSGDLNSLSVPICNPGRVYALLG